MRKYIFLLIAVSNTICGHILAQEKIDSIPPFDDSAFRNFSLVTELGWSGYDQKAGTTIRNYDWINSKSVNISLFQAFRLKSESIQVKFGVGLALDGYKFKEPTDVVSNQNGQYSFSDLIQQGKFRKSKFVTNYIGIPIEIQLQNRWLYPLKFSLGFRSDLLFNAHVKQKWVAKNGDVLKEKTRIGDYNLNKYRASIYSRFSISHLGFYGQYSLNGLFNATNDLQLNPIVFGVNYLID